VFPSRMWLFFLWRDQQQQRRPHLPAGVV